MEVAKSQISHKTWKEVSKSNLCPLCNHSDWCFLLENSEAVICGRTHHTNPPLGWRYVNKDAIDGRPIFAVIKDSEKVNRQDPRYQRPPKPSKAERGNNQENQSPSLSKIELARLPSKPNDHPIPQSGNIPQWLLKKGVSETATETNYQYSENQWVSRYDWQENGVKKKTIRQYHRKNGKVKCSKGNQPWNLYRIDEAICYAASETNANAKDKWILGLEGEQCVEITRSLQIVAITWQGSSWGIEEITAGLQSLMENGILGMIYFPDNDEEGRRKANKILEVAESLGFKVIVIDPTQIWEEMPHKGDISDWVNQIQYVNDDEYIRKIEELANAQSQQEEFSVNEEISWEIPDSFRPNSEYTQSVLNTLYGDDHWICVSGKLYYWTGTHYHYSKDVVEKKRIRDFLNNFPKVNQKTGKISYPYAKASSVENALKWVKITYGIDPDLVNPSGINCTNGVLKINWLGSTPSWELIDHHPSQYYLYEPVATFDPSADSSMCDRLLSALDRDQLTIFLRTIAASLDLGTVRRYKGRLVRALLLKGQGSNGKDTFREIVRMMYGFEGVTGCTLSDFRQYDEGRKFPLSRLSKSRVNWSSENATFAKLDNIQSLKAAITGDTLSKEGKGVDEEEFDPMGIFLFNCNDAPRLMGSMEAIASRYGVLSFNKTFKENADPSKGEIEAEPRFKYDPEFLKTEVLPAFLNRVLGELDKLMVEGIDYSVTESAIKEIQAENSHLFQFCQDLGLDYSQGGSVSAGEVWERLEQWYIEQGTLTYEESTSGKKKALWIDQPKKGDRNVKGMNQIIQRFTEIFPKAKRGKNHNNQIVLRGLGFVAEGSSVNASNVDEIGVSGIHAEGSNYTAIGNDVNPSNPDIAMGSGNAAEGSEGTEGSFLNPRENQDNFSPTQVNQPSEPSSETIEVDTEMVESGKTASIALSAYGSNSEVSQDKGFENDNCLRTADNGGEELHKLASAAPTSEVIDTVAINELVTQVGWDNETLLMDLLVKYDKQEISELEEKEALDLANRLKAEIFRQNLQQKK